MSLPTNASICPRACRQGAALGVSFEAVPPVVGSMAPPSEPLQSTTRGMLVGGVGAHPHAVCMCCARRVGHALRPGPPHRWALRGEPEGPALKVVASWPSARCWGPVRHGAGLVASPQSGAWGPNEAYVLQGSTVPLRGQRVRTEGRLRLDPMPFAPQQATYFAPLGA